tara:strand:- start:1547 stop:2053 length:507 start_codon:yes stop_codon:yes gene_type:complete
MSSPVAEYTICAPDETTVLKWGDVNVYCGVEWPFSDGMTKESLREIAQKLEKHLQHESYSVKVSDKYCAEVEWENCMIISHRVENIEQKFDMWSGYVYPYLTYFYLLRIDSDAKKVYGCPFVNIGYISDRGDAPLTSELLPEIHSTIEKFFVENYGAEVTNGFPKPDE